jgi:hypothetical protein
MRAACSSNSTIPYDLRFFESLNRIVQAEPWLERDKAMIDSLKTIGIERGKLFKPDAKTKRILGGAILEAQAVLEEGYGKFDPFYPGGHWCFPVGEELARGITSSFTEPDSYPVDARGSLYTFIFFSAKHPGHAQYYLLADRDKSGRPLEGSASYRLRVPANAPVTQYWSMTVYDRATHAFIPQSKVGPVVRRRLRSCSGTQTARRISTSAPKRRVPKRTGFRRMPTAASRFSRASTARKRRCSRRRLGSCPTSRKSRRK